VREFITWTIVVLSLIALSCMLLYIGYEGGRLEANRKWLKATQQVEEVAPQIMYDVPQIMYDVVFYLKSDYKVHTIPIEKGSASSDFGCLVVMEPDFRLYCEVVAAYPCVTNCRQSP
jgi:hypothetical protein